MSREISPEPLHAENVIAAASCSHPVVHLHIFNANGDLYLQKRPEWKDIQPEKWDTAVGGHIDLGESVDIALSREANEELGYHRFHSRTAYQLCIRVRT